MRWSTGHGLNCTNNGNNSTWRQAGRKYWKTSLDSNILLENYGKVKVWPNTPQTWQREKKTVNHEILRPPWFCPTLTGSHDTLFHPTLPELSPYTNNCFFVTHDYFLVLITHTSCHFFLLHTLIPINIHKLLVPNAWLSHKYITHYPKLFTKGELPHPLYLKG